MLLPPDKGRDTRLKEIISQGHTQIKVGSASRRSVILRRHSSRTLPLTEIMVTMTNAPVTPERIYQMAWSYAPPLILEAAIRHRVFDVLDSGPQSLAAISHATGASERGLSAILNVLVSLAFVSKDAQGNYSNMPEASAFLVTTKPSFQGGLLRHTSEELLP